MGRSHSPPQPVWPPVDRQNVYNPERLSMALPEVSEIRVRVNYSETDQMGVVYHARYLVWLDVARTEHLRQSGTSYRDLELQGFRLAVSEVSMRYRQPARFDDAIRVRCWVRAIATRRVEFGYAVEHETDGTPPRYGVDQPAVSRRRHAPHGHAEAGARGAATVPDPVRLGLAGGID